MRILLAIFQKCAGIVTMRSSEGEGCLMAEKKYAIMDVGGNGRLAWHYISAIGGGRCTLWVDDDCSPSVKNLGISVVTLEEWKYNPQGTCLLLTGGTGRVEEKAMELENQGIRDYEIFDVPNVVALSKVERLVSYAWPNTCDDVILYPVFRDVLPNMFYIDVGCNDPVRESVTKFFYDRGAHGIDIDPLQEYISLYATERPRDTALCLAVGEEQGETELFVSGFYGTRASAFQENVKGACSRRKVAVRPLADICREYVPSRQEVHLLKIDVEGMEMAVVRGMDWQTVRPWVVCLEAAMPGSGEENWQEWEPIMLGAGYEFAFAHGINRFYVAEEHQNLAERFMPLPELMRKYYVLEAKLGEA